MTPPPAGIGLKYYSLKVKKFHGDSVKNESARTKKNYRGGGWAPNAPFPRQLRVNMKNV